MPFELMYLLFLVLCFCTQPVGVVLSFGACFVEGESTIKSAAMPDVACVNESIYRFVRLWGERANVPPRSTQPTRPRPALG